MVGGVSDLDESPACDECRLPEPVSAELVAALDLSDAQWAVIHQYARAARLYRQQMGDAFALVDEVDFVHWVLTEQRMRGHARVDQREHRREGQARRHSRSLAVAG